jgi:hypothetical protein
MTPGAQIRRQEIRQHEREVLDYLESNRYLDIWSSIGVAGLLRRKQVRRTRKGLTLCRKRKTT